MISIIQLVIVDTFLISQAAIANELIVLLNHSESFGTLADGNQHGLFKVLVAFVVG